MNFYTNDKEYKILEKIALEAKSFDEIINNMDIDTPTLMISLTELELMNLIKQINNKGDYKNGNK